MQVSLRSVVHGGVVVVAWLVCAALIFLAWHDMYQSILHENVGIIPAGMMGVMWILTGIAVGLGGTSIARLFEVRSAQ